MKMQNCAIFAKKNQKVNISKIKNAVKLEIIFIIQGGYSGAARSICNLKYSGPKEIILSFHSRSNYNYHFLIKELVEVLEGQFIRLAENTEKWKTCSVPIKKEVTRIDKNGEEITKTISDRLQFTDSARVMASSLSNLADNLVEEFYKIKCKRCNTCCLEYTNTKYNLIEYKRLCCNENYYKF